MQTSLFVSCLLICEAAGKFPGSAHTLHAALGVVPRSAPLYVQPTRVGANHTPQLGLHSRTSGGRPGSLGCLHACCGPVAECTRRPDTPRTKSRRLDHFLATNRPWAGKHSAGETRERVDWQITVTRPLIVKYSVLTRTTIGCCVSGNPKPAQPRRNGPRDGQRCKKLALIRVGSKYPECLISYCGTYGT